MKLYYPPKTDNPLLDVWLERLIKELEAINAVEDDAYGAGWDGDTTHAPSQNAVYDKIESIYDKIVQVVNTETGAVATGTTITPIDDTIPQNDEGDEYITLAITPKFATSMLIIEHIGIYAFNLANTLLITALFRDATASALAVVSDIGVVANNPITIPLRHYIGAVSTNPTTFKIRTGAHQAGTTTLNGSAGARLMGDRYVSSITITEIAA